jgi:hypothetical protein
VGSKSNPGPHDCYSRAEPDEPMFVLLGRDPMAAILVELWAAVRECTHPGDPMVAEALKCAADMELWARHARGNAVVHKVKDAFVDYMARELRARGLGK